MLTLLPWCTHPLCKPNAHPAAMVRTPLVPTKPIPAAPFAPMSHARHSVVLMQPFTGTGAQAAAA
eukprot:1151171-Pelagomonas_calceolata.AAC.1